MDSSAQQPFTDSTTTVWIIENLQTERVTIPHGDPTFRVNDLSIGGLERRQLIKPEIWRKSTHLARAERAGMVRVFNGTFLDLVPDNSLPPELTAGLDPLDIEKARQIVVHPDWNQQLEIINVVPQNPDSPGVLADEDKRWLITNHLRKLQIALAFAAKPHVRALVARQGRDIRVIERALRKRIAEIDKLRGT